MLSDGTRMVWNGSRPETRSTRERDRHAAGGLHARRRAAAAGGCGEPGRRFRPGAVAHSRPVPQAAQSPTPTSSIALVAQRRTVAGSRAGPVARVSSSATTTTVPRQVGVLRAVVVHGVHAAEGQGQRAAGEVEQHEAQGRREHRATGQQRPVPRATRPAATTCTAAATRKNAVMLQPWLRCTSEAITWPPAATYRPRDASADGVDRRRSAPRRSRSSPRGRWPALDRGRTVGTGRSAGGRRCRDAVGRARAVGRGGRVRPVAGRGHVGGHRAGLPWSGRGMRVRRPGRARAAAPFRPVDVESARPGSPGAAARGGGRPPELGGAGAGPARARQDVVSARARSAASPPSGAGPCCAGTAGGAGSAAGPVALDRHGDAGERDRAALRARGDAQLAALVRDPVDEQAQPQVALGPLVELVRADADAVVGHPQDDRTASVTSGPTPGRSRPSRPGRAWRRSPGSRGPPGTARRRPRTTAPGSGSARTCTVTPDSAQRLGEVVDRAGEARAAQVRRVDVDHEPAQRLDRAAHDAAHVVARRWTAGRRRAGADAARAYPAPARSWTTPSCRSAAICRRSRSDADSARSSRAAALGLVPGDPAGERHGDRGLDELQQQQRADRERHDPQDQVVRRALDPVVAEVDLEGQRRLPGQPQRRVHLDEPVVAAGQRPRLGLGGDVRGDGARVDRRGDLFRDREPLADVRRVVGVDDRAGAVPDVELGDRRRRGAGSRRRGPARAAATRRRRGCRRAAGRPRGSPCAARPARRRAAPRPGRPGGRRGSAPTATTTRTKAAAPR